MATHIIRGTKYLGRTRRPRKDGRLPTRAAELREEGRRRRGRARLRWDDCVKRYARKAREEGDWKKKARARGGWKHYKTRR